MIRWIIRQTDRDLIPLDKFQQTLHKLGTPTVILWTIVQIDEQRLDMRKALVSAIPPIDETIHQTIAGDFGGHCIQKKLIRGREENPHWRDCCPRRNVVLCGL